MGAEKERLIYHIDVNSAFLSWESVYRLSMDENALDLRTIPCAVGGDSRQRRGIILAKSTPAKQFGVTTGEPISRALQKCPGLLIVPSRFSVYLKYSRLLMELLEQYTPDIEKFSIDEAFLDMTSTIHLFGDPIRTAENLREQIERELGFTVNIGIAPNKLLAKMASDFQKPNRCHTLFREEIPHKMWPLPVQKLFFAGHSACAKLEGIGVKTIGQLAACDEQMLKYHLGGKYAALIHSYALGLDDDPVREKDPVHKGYGNSITLAHDISDFDSARQVLLSLSETVGARLRMDGVACGCISVEIKDWDFHSQSHQTTLEEPTDSTSVIYQISCRLLKDFWDLTPLRLMGIRTTRISEEPFSQMSLFQADQAHRMRNLERAVDSIRSKYGVDIMKRASFLQGDGIVDHASGKNKHWNKKKD